MSGPRRWFSAFLPSAPEPPGAAARFLDRGALSQPAAAIVLVAKEQLAVAESLPLYLDEIREETRAKATASAADHHRNTRSVAKQITTFTTDLAGRAESASVSDQIARLAERTELLAMLGDSIRELTDGMRDSMQSSALATLFADMAEGLHVVLLYTVDAIEHPNADNLDVLHHLTADRSQLMETIRRSLLRGEYSLTLEEHQALFTSTRLFERTILLLRQLQTGLTRS